MPARRKSRSSPRRSKGSRSKSPRRVLKRRSSGKAHASRRSSRSRTYRGWFSRPRWLLRTSAEEKSKKKEKKQEKQLRNDKKKQAKEQIRRNAWNAVNWEFVSENIMSFINDLEKKEKIRFLGTKPEYVVAVMGAIRDAIENNGRTFAKLKYLSIVSCSIGAREMSKIAPVFQLPPLLTLNLTDNHIGDDGMEILSETLAKTDLLQLEALMLGRNGISPEGIEKLGVYTKKYMCVLQVLDLNSNMIGDKGVEILLDILTNTRADDKTGYVEELYIADNGISDAGIQALTNGISGGKLNALTKISIRNNNISEDTLKAFKEFAGLKLGLKFL